QLLHDGRVIESFLEDAASQLTYLGLLGLYDSLGEGMLCAFFRNNHFSTMLKRDGKLYLLVTDTGYACEPDIVWELLDEIDGNTEFVDSDFRLASQARSQPVGSGQGSPLLADGVINPSRNLIDPDTLLALQLSQSNETSASIPSAVGHVAPPTVHQKEPDTSTSHAQEVFDRE
ncbi:Mindy2, partial [Symbiodinium microadriaticum]